MKQAPDLIKFSDWYACHLMEHLFPMLYLEPALNSPIFFLTKICSLQTIESSAHKFVGAENSSSLAATVV